jgi:hypothetical protein
MQNKLLSSQAKNRQPFFPRRQLIAEKKRRSGAISDVLHGSRGELRNRTEQP